MEVARGTTLIPLSPEEIPELIGEPLVRHILAVIPEVARRARYGEYMNDEQAQEATGLSKRQLRYLREKGTIPYRSLGQRTLLYKTEELFAAIDEGTVPVRETFD